jgi:hypothetical protein
VSGYVAQDLARHTFRKTDEVDAELATYLNHYWDKGFDDVEAAKLVADSCAVGYGGHFYEVTEQTQEEEVIHILADELAPRYLVSHDEALAMLEQVRLEYVTRLLQAADGVQDRWQRQGYPVELRDKPSLDDCPSCGKRIKDFDELGCEDGSGQRWCVGHAMDALAAWREVPRR